MRVSGDRDYLGIPEVWQVDRASTLTKHREKRKVGKKGEKGSDHATHWIDGLGSRKHHDSLSERRLGRETLRSGWTVRLVGSRRSTWWRRNSSNWSTPGSFSPPLFWFALTPTPSMGSNELEDTVKTAKDPVPW